MFLSFEKWHGCRNDFIVIWLNPTEDQTFRSLVGSAKHLCARDGRSIGADGIIVLHKSSTTDLLPSKISIINSDGSLARTCGNGIRCAASSVLRKNLKEGRKGEVPEGVEFSIADQIVRCSFVNAKSMRSDSTKFPIVCVEMGTPLLEDDSEFFDHVASESKRVLGTENFAVAGCKLGNQHIVIHTDRAFNIDTLRKFGPKFQHSDHWDGINVHLVKSSEPSEEIQKRARAEIGFSISELIHAASWERGAGETAACGSGACAIGAIALNSGFIDRSEWVGIQMPGGLLYVKQDEPNAPIQLAGPAELAFDGVVEI